MPTYVVTGRVLPERTNFDWPIMHLKMRFGEEEIKVYICVLLSNVIIHFHSRADLNTADIRNASFKLAGDIVNVSGFFQNRSFSYDIELITCLETERSEVFGVDGYTFDDETTRLPGTTFCRTDGPISVPVALYMDDAFTRATFELRCAIRYPDYTALHCRLAIESIRNAFDNLDEANGWRLLREQLQVTRKTLERHKDHASDQRHGRNLAQSWPERRECLQIAWEISHRYAKYVTDGRQPLSVLPIF